MLCCRQHLPVRKFRDIQARIPTVTKLSNKQTKKQKTVILGGTHKFILEKLMTNFHSNYNAYSIHKCMCMYVSKNCNSKSKVEMLTNQLHCGTTDSNIFHNIL